MAKKDYYVLLGIPRFKSPAGIHEAFRRLAKKYHPDLGGPETAEAFQEIAHAYEILSDPEQRRTYDQTLLREYEEDSPPAGKGTVPLKREGALKLEPVAQAWRPWRYQPEPLIPRPASEFGNFETIGPSLDALFVRNFTCMGVPRGNQVEDINFKVVLSPFEAAQGVIARIRVPVFHPCSLCSGSGRDWLFPCIACRGQGMFEGEITVSVRIPPMVRDGTVIEVPIEGPGARNFFLRLHVRVSSCPYRRSTLGREQRPTLRERRAKIDPQRFTFRFRLSQRRIRIFVPVDSRFSVPPFDRFALAGIPHTWKRVAVGHILTA